MTRFRAIVVLISISLLSRGASSQDVLGTTVPGTRITALRQAIDDLRQTFGERYRNGATYAERLNRLEQQLVGSGGDQYLPADCVTEYRQLQREALLANPLLDFPELLVVKRRPVAAQASVDERLGNDGQPLWASRSAGAEIGLPSNHECNSSLSRLGYDNELAALSPTRPELPLRTVHRPAVSGYVGEIDLHWEANRLLLTQSNASNWKVFELSLNRGDLRQVTQLPDDVDCYDACYLPDGRIVFGSSAPMQAVPCWHGLRKATNLYRCNADGTAMRRLCYDQDHDLHPVVAPNGQVLYSRWDYTGISHIYLRQLMLMNPDGTGQRAIYGSGSWYPNALYFPQPLPGAAHQWLSVLSGYHGVHKMGQLVLLDVSRGWHEAEGIVQRISGRGSPISPMVKDDLVSNDWPKFLHPFPLSEKYFLVAAWLGPKSDWGIYLADAFDNLVLLREEPGYALLEPIPLVKRAVPPVIPDRVRDDEDEATVYLHDVYLGPGLAGVPRGMVQSLRVISYEFGYPHLAGPHWIGRGGPWEAMRILGTVPVASDGSAIFRVPANTPLALQPLDADGRAVQLMRSWFTAMPGEVVSCIGCHESPSDAAPLRPAAAQLQQATAIQPWQGPARGFDFEREIQPVLNRYCVSCHDGPKAAAPDLRPLAAFPDYIGQPLDDTSRARMHPDMFRAQGGRARYTPAYDALIRYVRRVGIEDEVELLTPGEYFAANSELLQLLRKGHYGVQLDRESSECLATWIDLNAPCHGTWQDVFPIPERMQERRHELASLTSGPDEPFQSSSVLALRTAEPITAAAPPRAASAIPAETRDDGPPMPQVHGRLDGARLDLDLGDGVRLELIRVPAGTFVMGSPTGPADEQPSTPVVIEQPFWIGTCEITNRQFQQFVPDFDAGYYVKRHASADDRGLPLNDPRQPAVRVSWHQAVRFCDWLSQKTSRDCSLPTEAQWEWAGRAGSPEAFSFGSEQTDFSAWANLADGCFARGYLPNGKQITGGVDHLLLEGADLAASQWQDQHIVTAPVRSYRPNAWGLYDMHGNAAEWTLSAYAAYPYRDADGRNDPQAAGDRVVRGGSFCDRPARSLAGYRLPYSSWQRPFNVGFRIVCVDDTSRLTRNPTPRH